MAKRDGFLGVYVGVTRSGKTTSLINDVIRSRVKRGIVWSPKESIDRYHVKLSPVKIKIIMIDNLATLRSAVNVYAQRNVILIYTGRNADFEAWCWAAYLFGIKKPCFIIAEELADVTGPAKAPEGWGNIARKILGFGCDVYAVTQRPAESDKTAFRNRSYIVIHRTIGGGDLRYIQNETGIDPDKLRGLPLHAWIRQNGSDPPTSGKLKKPA